MVGFYRYLFGFVRISVSGIRKESFINFCSSHGISVWKIKPVKGTVELNISIEDYRQIREIRKAIGNDIHIKLKSKRGLPLKLITIKKRSGIAVGIALALILNIFLSNYVWRIEINGEIDVKNEVISSCEKLGIVQGTRRKDIDTYFASQQLAIEYQQIAWCSVNVEGAVVTVNISPAKLSEEKLSKAEILLKDYDEPYEIDFHFATKVMEVIDAVLESAESGSWVKVGE